MFDALSDDDQAEMCGFISWEHSLCGECRQSLDLVTDPKVTWLVEDYTCWSCWSKERIESGLRKGAEKHPESLAGKRVYVKGPKLTGGRG